MPNSLSFLVIMAACLLGSMQVEANDVEQFFKLQREVFGEAFTSTHSEYVERQVTAMMELIKKGLISAEVQGKYNFEYLKSLQDDCSVGKECNINEDSRKLMRLKKRTLKNKPNLNSYLTVCREKIFSVCTRAFYRQAKASVNLDQQTNDTLKALTKEVHKTMAGYGNWKVAHRDDGEFKFNFRKIVLRTLKNLDPEGSKKMAKKWTNKDKSLRKFMGRVLSSCMQFLKQVDTLVMLWPAHYSGFNDDKSWNVMPQMHYTLKVCKKVSADWEDIVKDSMEDYSEFLVDPKPKSTCFVHGGGESREGGFSVLQLGLIANG